MENYIEVADFGVVSNTKVYGLSNAIRSAKFPMSVDINKLNDELTNGIHNLFISSKGEGHDQALTGIVVQFDLCFTVKAWTEAERYHFLDFISSQSTMHRITKFNLNKSYIEYVDPRIIDIMKEKVDYYNDLLSKNDNTLTTHDKLQKLYLEILYSNPCGFKLTAAMTTNYRQLKTIYSQRKNHRLPEWINFCDWIKTLPYSELITNESK